jgi:hypothetical protein
MGRTIKLYFKKKEKLQIGKSFRHKVILFKEKEWLRKAYNVFEK